jgi:hypothetical protein
MPKPIRHLINLDGAPFSADDLNTLAAELSALDDELRKTFRNENATAIASHDAPSILIVAGPGTGKRHYLNTALYIGLIKIRLRES